MKTTAPRSIALLVCLVALIASIIVTTQRRPSSDLPGVGVVESKDLNPAKGPLKDAAATPEAVTAAPPAALPPAEAKPLGGAPGVNRLEMFKVLGATIGHPLDPKSAAFVREQLAGRKPAGRVTRLDPRSMERLGTLKPGDAISIPLTDRESIGGTVHFAVAPTASTLSVIGGLDGKAGSFSLERESAKVSGMILLPKEGLAFKVEQDAAGAVLLKEVLLSDVMCVPPAPESSVAKLEAAKLSALGTQALAGGGDTAAASAAEPAPILNSRPSAVVQLYLNFDGETVSGTQWNSQYNGGNPIVALPSGLTVAEMTTVFNEVAEHFRAFDVNVSTDAAKYNQAPLNQRYRCVITPTNTAGGGDPATLGIAYTSTFGSTSPSTICWAFTHDVSHFINGIAFVASAIAHELGHTFGLNHDGTVAHGTTAAQAYFKGHGQGAAGNMHWGPIMGASITYTADGQGYLTRAIADVMQWSKGEYDYADNKGQDDVAIIASSISAQIGNASAYIPDEADGSRATAAPLSVSGSNVTQTGTITQETDDDFFNFNTSGGPVTITATRPGGSAALDVALEIQGVSGTVLTTANPGGTASPTVSATLSAGTYYLKVSGSGDLNPLSDGYSKYGSIGAYTLTGTGTFLAIPPTVTTPTVANIGVYSATLGGTVVSAGSAPITERGVVWSYNDVNSDPVINGPYVSKVSTTGTTGSFTVDVDSLAGVTGISFRAYATNGEHTGYSPVLSFSTIPTATPAVTTPTVSNISASTATLGGKVTSGGTSPIIERGVCYALTSVNADPFPNNGNVTKVTSSGTTGVFNVIASGLSGGVSYSFRAYALSAAGYGWSNVGTFTTPTSSPTATTLAPTFINSHGATLNGTVNANGTPTEAVFFIGTTKAYEFGYQPATPSSLTGSSTTPVSYLFNWGAPHTVYHYRAGSFYEGYTSVVYGEDATFDTGNKVPVVPMNFATVLEDTQTYVTLTASDADNDILTYTILGQPGHGTVVAGNGRDIFLYSPATNYSGPDGFVFQVTDGYGGTVMASFLLTVTPVEDPPTINTIGNSALNVNAGQQTVELSGVTAGGGETQTLTVTAASSNPAVIPNPTVTYSSPSTTGYMRYTPVANAVGSAVITVTVNDGVATTSTSFTVGVSVINKVPSFALPAGTVVPAGATMTARDSNRDWYAVASSQDGVKLAAVVYNGQIYTSTDSGVTWTVRETNRQWNSIACSADGTQLIASVQGGQLYTSSNSGATWTARMNNKSWNCVASSDDGMKLAAGVYGGYLYTSVDAGVTWDTRATNFTPMNWASIASSSDGTKLVAVVGNGQIYTSTDSGITFTARLYNSTWGDVASSADGNTLAVVSGSSVYRSIDAGVNWTQANFGGSGDKITCSADGTKLAIGYGQIFTSADSGLNWTTRAAPSTGFWKDLAYSADALKLVAVAYSGQIHTSVGTSTPYGLNVAANSGANTINSFATNISAGAVDESWQTVAFNVSNNNTALFAAQPAIAPNGSLTFTPNPSATGVATVTVIAQDNGGTASGGVDTSTAQTITITVGVSAPAVTAPASTNITTAGATLSGDVTGTGGSTITERGVVYALTLVNADPSISGTGVTKVTASGTTGVLTANVTGLGAGTSYSFKAYATNSAGTTYTSAASFTTISPAAPTVTTTGASGVTTTGATFGGTVNANNASTAVTFQYGTTNSYGQAATAVPSTVTGSTATVVNASATGLQPHTLYHFRVSGTNSAGTMNGLDATFSTLNSLPGALPQSGLATNEDTAKAITLAGTDADGDTLVFAIATQPTHGGVSISGTTAIYTPTTDYSGSDSFTFTASDAFGGTSTAATVGITVAAVNDPPTLASITNAAAINEDAGVQTVALTEIGTGAADETQTLVVTATSNNTALIPNPTVAYTSPNLTGSLSYAPVTNAHGTATITVTVNDGVDTTSQTFAVTVNPVNDVPSFTEGENQNLPALTSTPQSVPGWTTAIDDGDSEVVQALTFNVSADNAALFSVPPSISSGGTLAYTPNGTPGTAIVSVSLTDDATAGGAALTSTVQTFTITVTAPPEIAVTGNGVNIADGDATPSLADFTDFSSTTTNSGTVLRSFTINNSGASTLTLGTVTISGTDAADFSVTAQPASSVAPADSTTFQITFDPSAAGLRTATLSFVTNDADENPFNFSIQGTGYQSAAEAATANYAASYGLSGADAAPTAEPFNDGVPNLLKYAFNMPLTGPNVSGLTPGTGTGGLPSITAPDTGGPPDSIRVEFIRRRNSGLIYTPQYSINGLSNFIPMTATPVITIIDTGWERVVVNQPLGLPLPTATFSRVSVTAQ